MKRNLVSLPLLLSLVSYGDLGFGDSNKSGENGWTPEILREGQTSTYLPDFSYVGYHWGEKPIPQKTATMNVTDFGAVPDDKIDDTEAFKKALDAAHKSSKPVVLKMPKGRFIVNDILTIKRSDFVLQGSGSDANGTIIEIDKALAQLPTPDAMKETEEYLRVNNKKTKDGKLFSVYSWSGGFIWVQYPGLRIYPYLEKYDQKIDAVATAETGVRGSHQFTVNPKGLKIGDTIQLNWYNTEGQKSSLLQHLYMNDGLVIGSRHWENPQRPLITQQLLITAINKDTVTVKEPLLHDIRKAWQVAVTKPNLLQEVGLENFAIEFPNVPFAGHHSEDGYNGIYFTGSHHSWIKNVRVNNADTPILTDKVANLTITDIAVTGRQSHYGIHLGDVYNVLVKDTVIDAPSFHALSFNTYSRGSLYTHSEIKQNPSLDQHCGSNHQNLFDNIKITENNKESKLFEHGGDKYWAPTHGAYNTFWNIDVNFAYDTKGQEQVEIKGIEDGPHANFIGFHANRPVKFTYGPDAYIEGLNRSDIKIPSLYEFQLAKRLQSQAKRKTSQAKDTKVSL
ncbi:MAG: glycosyl hydrolase family 28-related protein [Oligoflexales bacterium]